MAKFNYSQFEELGYGDANYSDDSILDDGELLDYKQCMNIYRYWPLGKRIATSLPNFALSAPREVIFKDLPKDFVDRFIEIEEEYDIISIIKKTSIYMRIFGVSALFISCENKKPNEPLTFKDLEKNKIVFNIQDPLNLNGMKIGLNPLEPTYQKVYDIRINGKKVHPSRCYVGFNDLSFYLQYIPSNFNFGSHSIYQNMYKMIRSWNRCVIALERMATKGGSLVYKNREKGALNSIIATASKKSLQLIREMQNDGAVSIDRDDSIEFFNLSGIDAVDNIITQMNQILLMALNDTPAAILLDKELAQGFGNGAEDMKAILMAVDNFRRDTLKDIYAFVDKYLLYVTLSNSFLEEMKEKYSQDLGDYSIEELREKAISSFKYTWGNLYPETEATRVDNQSKKLENLIKLKELGANLSDIEQIINNDDKLYQEEITLEESNIESTELFNEDNNDDSTDTSEELKQDE